VFKLQTIITPTLAIPEGVKKLNFSRHPVKTGVQEIGKALEKLDSGFRRNDVKKTQIDFFTPSPIKGEGNNLGFRMETI